MLQTLSFQAGGRMINARASFFRYESGSAGGVDESIRVRADGNDLGLYLPGDSINLPVEASTWEITPVTPTTTGTVRLGIGRVESARLSGSVRVIDEITDAITHWGVNPPLAVAGTSFNQIIAPAANTKGLIIRGVNYVAVAGSGASAGCSIGLQALKSAPVDFNLPAQRFSICQAFSNSGVSSNGGDVHFNKLLPAGWGLYYWFSVSNVAAQSLGVAMEYELL